MQQFIVFTYEWEFFANLNVRNAQTASYIMPTVFYICFVFRSWGGLLTLQKTLTWRQWREYLSQKLAFSLYPISSGLNLEHCTSSGEFSGTHYSLMSLASVVVVMIFSTVSHHHHGSCRVICFSQPSPRLHYCRRLSGIGLTLRRLCQLRCLRLPLRVCQDLHEDHVLRWYSCCCKC